MQAVILRMDSKDGSMVFLAVDNDGTETVYLLSARNWSADQPRRA